MLEIFLGKGKKKWDEQIIRTTAIEGLHKIVSDYSDWYEEQGLILPPPYQADPSGWTGELQKMKRAFNLLMDDELHNDSDLALAREMTDQTKFEALENEIIEGLSSFGANLYWLTDPIKWEDRKH